MRRTTPAAQHEFVFAAARGEGHAVGLRRGFQMVYAEANLPGLRIHDLRHSFASFAVANGASLFLVGKLLGTQVPHDRTICAFVGRSASGCGGFNRPRNHGAPIVDVLLLDTSVLTTQARRRLARCVEATVAQRDHTDCDDCIGGRKSMECGGADLKAHFFGF